MDARTELFAYLGATIATVVALFTVQLWYESYLDVSVVHAQHRDAPLDPKLIEVRDAEHAKLTSGRLPIEQAISNLAQRGRAGFPKIAPKPSDDLSAMSGWIHKPGFAPYVPRPAQPAAAAAPEGAAVPAEGAPVTGSAAEGAQPAAAPAAPAAPAAAGAVAPAAPPIEATHQRVAPPGRTPSANPAP